MGLFKNNHSGYWLMYSLLSHNKNFKDNVVLLGKEKLESAFDSPTLFFANHTIQEDSFRIQLAVMDEMTRQHGKRPERIIRTVMADDIFLGDGHWHDIPKNTMLNALGQLSGQLLMKRIESKNIFRRKTTTKSIIDTLNDGDHVLIFPTGSMTIDGRIDYVKKSANRVFDSRAYEKIRGQARGFHVQPIHYTFDPVTQNSIVTVGDSAAASRGFDYPKNMTTCTTVTPFQIFSAYCFASEKKEHYTDPEEQADDVKQFIGLVQDKGINVFAQDYTNEPWKDAVRYHGKISDEKPKLEGIGMMNPVPERNSVDYQSAQIAHLGLEDTINSFVEMKKR